jgi:hypothetical protein
MFVIARSVQDGSSHMSFRFEGLSNFSYSVEELVPNPRCQSKDIEMKYETRIKVVHELYDGTCF